MNLRAKFADFSFVDTKKTTQLDYKDKSLHFNNITNVKWFAFTNKTFKFQLSSDSKFKLIKYFDDKTIDIENNTATMELHYEDKISEDPSDYILQLGIINGKPGMKYNLHCPYYRISVSYIENEMQIFYGCKTLFTRSRIGTGLTISTGPALPIFIFAKHVFKTHPLKPMCAKLGEVRTNDESYVYVALENVYLKPLDAFLSYHAKIGGNTLFIADIFQSKPASLKIFSNSNESTTFTISIQATPKLEISMNQIFSYISKPCISINYDSEMISSRKSVQEILHDFFNSF